MSVYFKIYYLENPKVAPESLFPAGSPCRWPFSSRFCYIMMDTKAFFSF